MTLQDGAVIYNNRFSKELLAYIETLVVFSQYYQQDNPRTLAHSREAKLCSTVVSSLPHLIL